MKYFNLVSVLFLSLFILSCEDPLLEENLEPEVQDSDCLSMTGERFEKYYLDISQEFLEQEITLSSPSVLGYEYNNETDPASYGFNQISLQDVELENFLTNSLFEASVSGTVAVGANSGSTHIAYSAPFEADILVAPARDYSREPFAVLNSFSNTPGDLILPYTGLYSTDYKVEDSMNFSVIIRKDMLSSLVTQDTFTIPYGSSDTPTQFTRSEIFPVDLLCQEDLYLLLTPVSRNFYQYENLTATFAPDSLISEIRPNESIVESHQYDPETNSITVVFSEYDYPYTGDVLFYTIKDADSDPIEKVIRIEG